MIKKAKYNTWYYSTEMANELVAMDDSDQMKSSDKRNPLFDLIPNEIIEMILLYLNPVKLRELRVINKRWIDIINYITSKEKYIDIPISIFPSYFSHAYENPNNILIEYRNLVLKFLRQGYVYLKLNGVLLTVVNYTISQNSNSVRQIMFRNGEIFTFIDKIINNNKLPILPICTKFEILTGNKGPYRNRLKSCNGSPNFYR